MQTTTTAFTDRARGQVRPLSWFLTMAFDKQFDDEVTFFTIGESLIGGVDVIRPTGTDVVQQWDKYEYTDYSNRVIAIEWDYQEDSLSSVTMPMADIVLDNHDDFFTPGSGSSISDYVLPYRPLKIGAGFKGENVPVFVGITEKMPEIDQVAKTVTFHAIGFLYSLYNRPLEEAVMYIDMRTDEVLEELFGMAGILASQLNLDPGFNTIPFAFFDKGTKLGEAVAKLMEAEMGRLYMDEYGTITFKNRQSLATTSSYVFGVDEIISLSTPKQDDIINVVEITSNVRAVQENQLLWEMTGPLLVPAGGSAVMWADFQDPAVSVDEPANYLSSPSTSWFEVFDEENRQGSVIASGVTCSDFDVFATSAKMTFSNSHAFPVWITQLRLFGEPAKVITQIYVREQDDVSVAKYDERPISIENDFISTEGLATSKALMMLDDYAEYGDIREIEVKGNPAIQLGDMVTVDTPEVSDDFIVTKKSESMANGKYTQRFIVKKFVRRSYFTVGSSLIGGSDVIAP